MNRLRPFILSVVILCSTSILIVATETKQTEELSKQENLLAPRFSIGPSCIIKGAINATDAENLHPYVLYFNGQKTRSDENGFFSFLPETEKELDTMYLLITRSINQKYRKGNSIKTICHHPERSRYFILRKNVNYSPTAPEPAAAHEQKPVKKLLKEDERYWNVEEQKLDENSEISDNCLILLVDPKFLKGLENWEMRLPENQIPFPKILLKNKKEMVQDKPDRANRQGYIREASFFSDSNSMTTEPFTRKIKTAQRNGNNGRTNIKTVCTLKED